jgi:hypothetical protein
MFIYCSYMEIAVTVGLERALETRRVRLLRLLTGWLAVVAMLSGGPLAVPLPRSVRAVFADLLIRAELAAQYMVYVSARLQARGEVAKIFAQSPRLFPVALAVDEVPSTAALLRRMRALRRLLWDLPRRGRRLLRHLRLKAMGRAAKPDASARSATDLTLPQWIAPCVEHPPDKDHASRQNFALASLGNGRRWCLQFSPQDLLKAPLSLLY